jgi:hypothetical protein
MPTTAFKSSVLAGFECSTGYNAQRRWFDQVSATQHDRYLVDDYEMVRRAGIRTVRDGVRWPLVDFRGRMRLSTVLSLLRASRYTGVEVIYDLFHFGFPADVDLFSQVFPARFAV